MTQKLTTNKVLNFIPNKCPLCKARIVRICSIDGVIYLRYCEADCGWEMKVL